MSRQLDSAEQSDSSGQLDISRQLASMLDHSSPVPLYYQAKQWFSSRILSGQIAPGTRLPGELELCQRMGVSRGVVRQALAELCYEGLVERQPGRGSFVSRPKTAEGLISGLGGLADDAASRGQVVRSKVLALHERPCTEAVASKLGIAPGEPVVELERLRTLDGEPHVLVMTYLPAAMVPGLAGRDFSGTASLYRALREDYGLPIVSSLRRVEAATAGGREARLLAVDPGSPLLVLRSTSYTTGRRALEHFVAFHRGDHSAFEVELYGPAGTATRFDSLVAPGARLT